MSFFDELTQQNKQKKHIYSDDQYVSCIIDAIKNACQANRNKRSIKGYIFKHCDSEYTTTFYCYVATILNKKDYGNLKKSAGSHNDSLYPGDPDADWEGPVFDINDTTIRKIDSAFKQLGFPNGRIQFIKTEIERVHEGFMHMITFTKTGRSAYLIYVDISW